MYIDIQKKFIAVFILSLLGVFYFEKKNLFAVNNYNDELYRNFLQQELNISELENSVFRKEDSATITNEISNITNAGNSANNQAVTQIKIRTEVNGQVIDDINHRSTSTGKTSTKVENKVTPKANKVVSETKMTINGKTTTTLKYLPIGPKTKMEVKPENKPIILKNNITNNQELYINKTANTQPAKQQENIILNETSNIFKSLWSTIRNKFKNILNII